MRSLEEIQACLKRVENVADHEKLGRIREQIETAENPEELLREEYLENISDEDCTSLWLMLKVMELEGKAKIIEQSNMSAHHKFMLIINLLQDIRWWVSAGELSDHECGKRFRDRRMMNSWQVAWVEEGVEIANTCGSATKAAEDMFRRHKNDAKQAFPSVEALREAIRRNSNYIVHRRESKKRYP